MSDTKEKIFVSDHLETIYLDNVEVVEFVATLNQYIEKYSGRYQKLTLNDERADYDDWNHTVLNGHLEETQSEAEKRVLIEAGRKNNEYEQYLRLKEKFEK